jgi:ABC-type nitrate/sulfonate/bicarbonate transport system ATPase subunit/ABC-type nitrate/sulfonate/bicarbonate transport system permease component
MSNSGDGSAFVRLENLGFSYGMGSARVTVLSNLNLEFKKAGITAIVGRSGCGKTTLLKIIAGLTPPESGRVLIDGTPGAGIRKGTSIIFQDFGLLPWATVRTNAELGLKIGGMASAERRRKVSPILDEVGLSSASALFPARLSGGMRQRVAIARALASQSDLLLLDEPFSSLDAITRESLQDSLLEAQRAHGATVILVTHSIEEAAYLADQVYVMEGKNPATIVTGIKTARSPGHVPNREPRAEVESKADPRPVTYRENPEYFADTAELRELFESRTSAGSEQEAIPKPGAWASLQAHRLPGKIARLACATGFVLAAWALLSLMLAKPFLPSPQAAFSRFAAALSDGSMLLHVGASLKRIFLSLALAGPPAWALGLAAGRIRLADSLASPLVYLLHPLPKVAFLPILMLFLGLGDASKVALMGLVVFGQLFVGSRDAARTIPASLVDTVRSLGGNWLAILRYAILPGTLPALLSSLRISLGTAIAVLFLSETFASTSGLGWYIMDAWSRVNYPDMYAAILGLSIVSLCLYLALDALEAAALRWMRTD